MNFSILNWKTLILNLHNCFHFRWFHQSLIKNFQFILNIIRTLSNLQTKFEKIQRRNHNSSISGHKTNFLICGREKNLIFQTFSLIIKVPGGNSKLCRKPLKLYWRIIKYLENLKIIGSWKFWKQNCCHKSAIFLVNI